MSIKGLKLGGPMNLNNSEEVFLLYQKGRDEAFEWIYHSYKDPLYRFIYRYTNNEQLSIDTVQDTFEKIQRKKHMYSPEKGKFKTYLFQIAYNTMITKLNRQKRLKNLLPFLAERPHKECSLDEKISVRSALQALPDDLRVVILLVYYHDLKQKEIADILKIPIGTVKSRLNRALKRLKRDLEVEENE